MKGLFITFEGIDGCGKTTQAERLAAYVSSRGREVVLTREPGGTEVSEKIRAILLDKDNHHMAWLTEMLLYMASRAQLTEEVIRPALEEEKVVISDRFMDATLAYQGYGRGLNKELICELNAVATAHLTPDVTFLVDLAPDVCGKRMAAIQKKADRLEGAEGNFHHRVREGYLEMAKQEPGRFRIIDGTKSIDECEQDVREIVRTLLQQT